MQRQLFQMAFLCAGLGFAGCSIAIPLPSLLGGDGDVTGSIQKPHAPLALQPEKPRSEASPLSGYLEAADWDVAKSALAVALEAPATGKGLAWGNPQTGAHGNFTAQAEAFSQGTVRCRDFLADIETRQGSGNLEGTACQKPSGEWNLAAIDVQPRS